MLWLPCGAMWMGSVAAIAAVIYSLDPKHNWWAWLLMIPGTGALMFLIFYVFNCDKEKMRVPRDKFLDCFASAGECALSRVLTAQQRISTLISPTTHVSLSLSLHT